MTSDPRMNLILSTVKGTRAIHAMIALALFSVMTPREATTQQIPEVRLNPHVAVAEEQFTLITSVRELRDGRLIVTDRTETRVAVVGWKPGASATIGRTGKGPSEYEGVGRVYELSADSTLFIEWPFQRLHLLEGPRIVRTLGHQDVSMISNSQIVGADRRGRIASVRGVTSSGRTTGSIAAAEFLILLLFDRSSGQLDTIARLTGRGGVGRYMQRGAGDRPGIIITANPLLTEEQAVLFPDGWIAVARTAPYRVEWRSPRGTWTVGAPLPFEPVRPSRREKCAAIGQPETCDPDVVTGWPSVLPPFLPPLVRPTLLGTADGNLVIRRTTTIASRDNRYDVVGRTGSLVGRLTLPANEVLVGFGVNSAYIAATDEDGLQTIRRHPWR